MQKRTSQVNYGSGGLLLSSKMLGGGLSSNALLVAS